MNSLLKIWKDTKYSGSFNLFKKEIKWHFNLSLWLKVLFGGIAFAAFFVGALDFQAAIAGHGTPWKEEVIVNGATTGFNEMRNSGITGSLVIPSIVISLLFGTLTFAGMMSFKTVETKFGTKKAQLFLVILFIIVALALAGMIMGAVAYSEGIQNTHPVLVKFHPKA